MEISNGNGDQQQSLGATSTVGNQERPKRSSRTPSGIANANSNNNNNNASTAPNTAPGTPSRSGGEQSGVRTEEGKLSTSEVIGGGGVDVPGLGLGGGSLGSGGISGGGEHVNTSLNGRSLSTRDEGTLVTAGN